MQIKPNGKEALTHKPSTSTENIMSLHAKRQQVLQVLVSNLNNPQPQVVQSEFIADKLNMPLKDICQLVKSMHQMGVVISDLEGQNSLITRNGIKSLSQ